MPSSISSSETGLAPQVEKAGHGARPVLYAAVLLALVAALLEFTGSYGFVHISRIQRRIASEYQAATHLRPIVSAKPTLLVLGNSLLHEGFDLQEFQNAAHGDYLATRFIVEQTGYVDWYYGIRRLFHEGMRPRVILLGMSVNQFVGDGVRGEYFAHYLLDTQDLPSVIEREKLTPTPASTILFANLSGWVGSKTEIRNWLLVKALPDIGLLGSILQKPGPEPPGAAQVLSVANQRLLELREICAPHNTRLIFVIPPTQDVREQYQSVEQAGKEAGIPVLVPYVPGEMPPGKYRDGYHLNGEGAVLFTRRLTAELLNLPENHGLAKVR